MDASDTGVFQIRGGKHMFVAAATAAATAADNPPIVLSRIQHAFLHGDQVSYSATTGTLKLSKRQEQYVIGTVAGFRQGRFILHFPQYAHFIAEVVCMLPVVRHDRILVYLTADGSILPLQVFSEAPVDDVRAVLAAYTAPVAPSSVATVFPTYTTAVARYTRPDVVDLTALFTFTVDPRDSVDLDDAISVDADLRRIYVHIVDMHAYLLTHPELEKRMLAQGQTLYLANEHTEHLLPLEHAADGASLVRGAPRAAITVEIQFGNGDDDAAHIVSYGIYRSTIIVKERYAYEDVTKLLDTNNTFQILHLLTQRAVAKHAYLNIPALRLTIGADGIPLACVPECTQDAAHSMVANAMILTNFLVSHHLAKYEDVYLPNRFHHAPPACSNTELVRICENECVNAFVTIKRWSRASYSVDDKGHFGLGLREYVHFTSPMRRYADVIVHHILAGAVYLRETMDALAAHANVRAVQVRALHNLYRSFKVNRYLHYVRHYPVVYITDVTRAGVLWYCPDYLLNGFTHVSKLHPVGRWALRDNALVHTHAPDTMQIRVGDAASIVEFFCDYATLQYTLTLRYSASARTASHP